MNVLKIAALLDGNVGGNPAGVLITERAATAAFAGYLRDIAWPHGGAIDIVQGEDMGMRSRLWAEIPAQPGGSIRVSGIARVMQ